MLKSMKTLVVFSFVALVSIVLVGCGAEETNFRSDTVGSLQKKEDKKKQREEKVELNAIQLFAECTGLELDEIVTGSDFDLEQAQSICEGFDQINFSTGILSDESEVDVI